VLAPIVDHADDARLATASRRSCVSSPARRRTDVAILSGRSLAISSELFAFPTARPRDRQPRAGDPRRRRSLDADEQRTFDQLELLGAQAVEAAGEGAWLEYKPASVVVHTRLADPELGRAAVDTVTCGCRPMIDGAQ
jgi:trehalose 6-phosphate phosphatase